MLMSKQDQNIYVKLANSSHTKTSIFKKKQKTLQPRVLGILFMAFIWKWKKLSIFKMAILAVFNFQWYEILNDVNIDGALIHQHFNIKLPL